MGAFSSVCLDGIIGIRKLIEQANERADRADARANAADADRRATEARADGESTEWREDRTRLVVEIDGLRAERDREKSGMGRRAEPR